MPRLNDPAGQVLPRRFAISETNPVSQFRNLIDPRSGFLGHTELPFAEGDFDVFRSIPHHRDFKIMNQRCAASIFGREFRNFVKEAPRGVGLARSEEVTLLLRAARGYVRTAPKVIG